MKKKKFNTSIKPGEVTKSKCNNLPRSGVNCYSPGAQFCYLRNIIKNYRYYLRIIYLIYLYKFDNSIGQYNIPMYIVYTTIHMLCYKLLFKYLYYTYYKLFIY